MSDREPRIYLDYNASAPLLPEARDAVMCALELANPSSTHREGRRARAVLEAARESVATLCSGKERKVDAEQVVFTSGATEAATQLLSPRWLVSGKETELSRLAVVETDHAATREGGRFDPDCVTRLPVDRHGIVRMAALETWLDESDGKPSLFALSWANSETGVIQPIARIRERIGERPVRLVLDAAQIGGRLPIDLEATGADAIVLSGHKMGAMKGVGAFVLADIGTRPFAMLRGGGHERGIRAGTEALPAIASFGAAAEARMNRIAPDADAMRALRHDFEALIMERAPETVILGEGAERLPNTVAIVHPGVKGETAQIALDLAGFAVSSGAACSSGKVGRSHVLTALASAGLPIESSSGAIRISFGPDTNAEALRRFVAAYGKLADQALAKLGSVEAA
ncbi:cysteine desulfurase family protein [Jiella marina]|uniref:cysteine desulfurase family protein n=1 Tax=Jiella sp. LLJ827 TaxID=2917712 RepID=UPI00210086D0|nr:cysteine desulfurase family protein [Jiella sp. LLJ827]MCQ0986190.1 cysteine desulfurase [Jiella sp. LLJ827]